MPQASLAPDAQVPDLGTLLLGGPEEAKRVPEPLQTRFATHWRTLGELGFHVLLRRDALLVSHPARDLEIEIQFSHEDDLGERRELYRVLRAAFGTTMEKWFPKLVQSSPAVARPYQSLKEMLEVCQTVRRSGRL